MNLKRVFIQNTTITAIGLPVLLSAINLWAGPANRGEARTLRVAITGLGCLGTQKAIGGLGGMANC